MLAFACQSGQRKATPSIYSAEVLKREVGFVTDVWHKLSQNTYKIIFPVMLTHNMLVNLIIQIIMIRNRRNSHAFTIILT